MHAKPFVTGLCQWQTHTQGKAASIGFGACLPEAVYRAREKRNESHDERVWIPTAMFPYNSSLKTGNEGSKAQLYIRLILVHFAVFFFRVFC